MSIIKYQIDNLKKEMDSVRDNFGDIFDQYLSYGIGLGMLPVFMGEIRIDVREHKNEIIVVADLPGMNSNDVSVRLITPRSLEISCQSGSDHEETDKGYYMRERSYGSMQRIVPLPKDVSNDGIEASFKNGVLEVRLKKTNHSEIPRIEIKTE